MTNDGFSTLSVENPVEKAGFDGATF